MSCGVGHRRGSDLALLWLWCRPAAIAPIRPLAWEPPYAADVALKRQKTSLLGLLAKIKCKKTKDKEKPPKQTNKNQKKGGFFEGGWGWPGVGQAALGMGW